MTPREQFEQLEIMSRERATLAKKEAEHWLAEAEYWLAEANSGNRLSLFMERIETLWRVMTLGRSGTLKPSRSS